MGIGTVLKPITAVGYSIGSGLVQWAIDQILKRTGH